MPVRVLSALLLLGLVAATAHEAAERRGAPPNVCFLPFDQREAPRCALPPAEAERAS